jgi:hypothetical protein
MHKCSPVPIALPVFRLVCSLVLLLVAAADGLAQDEEALKQRFLDEAPRSWDALIGHAFQLRGQIRTTWKRGNLSGRLISEIKEKPGNRLWQLESADSDAQGSEYTVYASNSDYIFKLKRKSMKSMNLPWVMVDFQRKEPGREFQLPAEYREEGGLSEGLQSSGLTAVSWSKLPDLVRQPSFRVARAAVENRDGLEFVRIDFENPHPFDQKPFEPVQSGTLLLDPERSWCVRGYEVHAQYANDSPVCHSDVIEVRDSSVPHLPLPARFASTTTHHQFGKGTTEEVFTETVDAQYNVEEPLTLPDSDFRLPAFGLPEPEGPATRPWWSLWAVGASLACIAAAGVWWWLLRRKAPKPAA